MARVVIASVLVAFVVVATMLAAGVSASTCACLVAPSPSAHCSNGFSGSVIVVRARFVAVSETVSAISILEVFFNNSPTYVYFGQEVKISSPSCTPSVEVGSTYFIRLTVVADGSLEYAACDYVISDANGDPTQLTCGKTLTDCDLYPCPTDTPQCLSTTLACVTTPCPQRTCTPCTEFCVQIGCGPGTTSVKLPGHCCPTCVSTNNCQGVACPPIAAICADGQPPTTAPGACCPSCSNSNCQNAACPAILCAIGLTEMTLPGDCCPTCVSTNNCQKVACPQLAEICPNGQAPTTAPGDCCPTCHNSCQNVACPAIACGTGSTSVIQPGSCCPTCVPDNCQGVACPAIEQVCANGQAPTVPAGGCCPICPICQCAPLTCQPNTHLVSQPNSCCPTCEACPETPCAFPLCTTTEHMTTLPGACCPTCVPNAGTMLSVSVALMALVALLAAVAL